MSETATLEIHICDERRGYRTTFSNEDQAIAFLERKRDMNHAWWELQETPIPQTWVKLLAFLYPECEHGLSLDLCYGPQHYASDAEVAMGY